MKRAQYFSMEKVGETANLNIYGDITSWPWEELGEVSANTLSKQLETLGDVSQINVFINSYGGEVAEGLAIYNALRRHKAKVVTYCDGFACSIASVIFMSGDERVMNESSLLMVHNAWTFASGNAEELRKQADDLEKITQASVEAYKAHSTLSEEEIKALMDNESWILPSEALEYGFATKIDKTEKEKASQNAMRKLFEILKAHQEAKAEDDPEEEPTDDGEEKPTEPTDTDGETGETENDDENGEGAEAEGEENTDGGEEDPEEPNEETQKNATQKWSGFFNAILRD